jgi:hypothetical protein
MFPNCPTPPLKKYIHVKGLRSFLGEFDAEFKKALARELGVSGVLFESRKSRDTVPLMKKENSGTWLRREKARLLFG